MHQSSYKEMARNLKKYAPKQGLIVDVGSMDINGSYKDLFSGFQVYMGLDIRPGPNVDRIITNCFPLSNNSVDLVISGQCLEHVENPFHTVSEIYRVLKSDSYVILVAPAVFVEHNHPDRWRFLPDGMTTLLKYSGFEVINSYTKKAHIRKRIQQIDCWGIGKKP